MIGEPLAWTSTAVRHQIGVERPSGAKRDRDSWPEQYGWLLDRLEKFRKTFRDRIARLSGDDLNSSERDKDKATTATNGHDADKPDQVG